MKLVGVDAPLAAGADASLTERGRNIRSGQMCSVSLLLKSQYTRGGHYFVSEALRFRRVLDRLRKFAGYSTQEQCPIADALRQAFVVPIR